MTSAVDPMLGRSARMKMAVTGYLGGTLLDRMPEEQVLTMDIEIARRPETFRPTDTTEICVRIPLTATPDEVLMDELASSPQLASFCERIERGERELVVYLREDDVAGLSTMLTAIQALVAIANGKRASEAMTGAQGESRAVEARQRKMDAELEAWWDAHE
jgi:hypothetical protein